LLIHKPELEQKGDEHTHLISAVSSDQSTASNLMQEINRRFGDCLEGVHQHLPTRSQNRIFFIKIAYPSFVAIMAATTIPFFLKTGLRVDSPSNFLRVMIPGSAVILNVFQTAYAADETWIYYAQDPLQKEGKKKKMCVNLSSIFLSAWPTFPIIVGAIAVGESIGEAIFLGATTGISALIYNIFFSNRFILEGFFPLTSYLSYKYFNSRYQWNSTYRLKSLVMKSIIRLRQQLEDNPESALEILQQLIPYQGNSENRQSSDSIKNSICSTFFNSSFNVVKKGFSVIGAGALTFCWLGYSCEVKNTISSKSNVGWGFVPFIMLPLIYVTGSMGYNFISRLGNMLQQKLNKQKVSIPLSFCVFPKTIITLTLILTFLSLFSWAGSVVLTEERCPAVIRDLFIDLVYGSSVAFNIVLGLELLDKILFRCIQYYGNDDHKISAQLMNMLDTVMGIVTEVIPENFVRGISSEKAKGLTYFFSKGAIHQEYHQLLSESVEELKAHDRASIERPNGK
jgi:hypothetical protein